MGVEILQLSQSELEYVCEGPPLVHFIMTLVHFIISCALTRLSSKAGCYAKELSEKDAKALQERVMAQNAKRDRR